MRAQSASLHFISKVTHLHSKVQYCRPSRTCRYKCGPKAETLSIGLSSPVWLSKTPKILFHIHVYQPEQPSWRKAAWLEQHALAGALRLRQSR